MDGALVSRAKPKTPQPTALAQYDAVKPIDPDALPYTLVELDHLYKVARTITMQHRLFTMVGIDWHIDPRLLALVLSVRGKAPDRDAPSTYDAERYDVDTGLVFDRVPLHSWHSPLLVSAAVPRMEPRHQPLVPFVSQTFVRVPRALMSDR
jgi:hypothetical protein